MRGGANKTGDVSGKDKRNARCNRKKASSAAGASETGRERAKAEKEKRRAAEESWERSKLVSNFITPSSSARPGRSYIFANGGIYS